MGFMARRQCKTFSKPFDRRHGKQPCFDSPCFSLWDPNPFAEVISPSAHGSNQQIAHWPVECCSVHSRKDKISTGGVEAGRCLSEAAAPPKESHF